jgi:hypothetical protein
MKRYCIGAAIVVCAVLALNGFSQVGINATLSGTVSDSSGALIPGVEVTATQTSTGVASISLTNESGTYRFPSLQPGPYDVKAALAGFQTQTFRLTLGTTPYCSNLRITFGQIVQGTSKLSGLFRDEKRNPGGHPNPIMQPDHNREGICRPYDHQDADGFVNNLVENGDSNASFNG